MHSSLATIFTCLALVVVSTIGGCGSASHAVGSGGDDAGSTDGGTLGSVDGGSDGSTGAIDAAGPISAAMNDVSILFPLPSSAAEVQDLLTTSSSGARGTLVPSDLYAAVGPIAGSSPNDPSDAGAGTVPFVPSIAAYSDLRVVAMRIDPCFASLAPDPHGVGCTAQIRLIFQEVLAGPDDGGVSAFDSGLHAFYSLSRDEFLSLAQALVALRVANASGVSLGPLAPHPVIVSQGLEGAMSTGVKALILQYAGAQNLTRLAQLSNGEASLPVWFLSAVNVSDAGAAVSSLIPTLDHDGGMPLGSDILQQADFSLPGSAFPGNSVFAGSFTPSTASADNLLPLDDGTPSSLSTSARQAAFDALVRIENPADNSPNTIDCGSCHIATPTEALVAMPLFSLDDTTSSLAFQPDGKSVVAADMTPTFSASSGQLNIHTFSYVGQSPAISQRVVNETAAIVEYLNNLPN